jgi:predicted CoA-binding protein
MTTMESIRDFLGQKRLAIVGVSRRPNHFSRVLFRELRKQGYDTVPLNPYAAEIDGERCFARLQDVTPPVAGAIVMTSETGSAGIVQDCATAGVRRVWLYRGTGGGAVTDEAVESCRLMAFT